MHSQVDAERPETDTEVGLRDLGWALGAVLRSWMRATSDAVADVPGGPRGYQVMAMATGGPCGTQAAMAERIGVDRTVMTHLIDDLEAKGLVERRPDPADRRARTLVLTTEGSKVHARVQGRLREVERHVLGPLDEEAADAFRSMLFTAAEGVVDAPRDSCAVAQELEGTA